MVLGMGTWTQLESPRVVLTYSYDLRMIAPGMIQHHIHINPAHVNVDVYNQAWMYIDFWRHGMG